MEYAVIMKGIRKSFGKQAVLNDLNFAVPYGNIICLLGPSGGGKSTAIKIITGTLKADSGTCIVVGDKKPTFGMYKKIGYMPQDDAIYETLSGYENLRFFGGCKGMKGARLSARIEELAELMDLTDSLKKIVSTYSGGMKRRLSLAAAMLDSPDLFILDEPTVGLDPLLRVQIWDEFRRLADAGAAVLVTTHVMDEVARCDDAALMRGGRILVCGSPEKIMRVSGTSTMEDAFIKYSYLQEGGRL